MKHKIYPSHHKKYCHCTIEKKGKRSFTVIVDTHRRFPNRIRHQKSNFISYKKALRFVRKQAKKHNFEIRNMIYDKGDYCECVLTSHNQVMKFDKEDIEMVQKHVISVEKNVSGKYTTYYANVTIKGKRVRFHDIIMDHDRSIDTTITVDHIVPGDTLNNQKNNLRLATSREQSINRRTRANNISGYKGVSYNQGDNRWVASWIPTSRKEKSKSFSCKIYGDEQAKELAKAYRDKMTSEIADYRFMTFK
jgi:hypothetical protein